MSNEYSLWFIPDRDSDAYRRLSSIISEYAEVYDDAPEFRPHITILGGIDRDVSTLKKDVKNLAEECNPVQTVLTGVQCSTTKHQCVFLLVEATMNILSAHKAMRDTCNIDHRMYVPHLSIIYSEMNITERLQIINSIDVSSLQGTIYSDEIALINTKEEVPDWEMIESYDLSLK
uniref:Probable tRNA splicing protein, cyclic phosphodiesterase n=1 Tax=uncultured haloarchaeon TaxID=160804 RepID=A5YSV1_9EURY|nr:probable tRNA splicing protein, cyclic phosphodiesterase [uncultured haloarchaeon]